ncbi:P-II family nitrogen regulator [Effusibacillus dendaii]|uniref:Nitrogen regulatory protein P-II 1 n=1 Tax=Effusibacillus dendaii TaxID=2743772 RepID=A0A7I8DEC2_9BACL|nr:P-II family nitrogen regulator [Effusibacillus dendaii]BCJ86890.1 nitrogen regulatory protein P-II 1 [Effusibacillus dendaii]
MKKIEAIIRPEKLQEVIAGLREVGITAFTVLQAQGRGQQKNTSGVYRGHAYSITLHPKLKMEMVVSNENVKPAVEAIIKAAQTGEMGDGKIFVYPVEEAYNIRTGSMDETIDELNR